MTIQEIKNRFGIIGGSPSLDRAIDIAAQVASTDLSVLITGESGSGKEVFPQIIHTLGSRKHGPYIAVNCGAIPEGTIDSELFGHEKGSFTGASGSREGYFQVADGGTIFLDEVAELPMQTQVRLLRVLETGEFIRVGSSKVIKTNVRVVAATNENMSRAIQSGKFREDLLYRLSTVPISLPPLRQRKEDINLIFRKFASDFADKYRMPPIKLTEDAVHVLENYNWPGNIRQLKNLVEQISVIENKREIDGITLQSYLPKAEDQFPSVINKNEQENFSERELMYKFLFDMKSDLNDLKKLVTELINQGPEFQLNSDQSAMINRMYNDIIPVNDHATLLPSIVTNNSDFRAKEEPFVNDFQEHVEVEESLSLEDREKELIQKALDKHRGKRKYAADELGISERTLYRKIKEYNLPG